MVISMLRYAVKWMTKLSGSDCTNHIANSWPRNLQSWGCHDSFQRRNFEVKYASGRVSAKLNLIPAGHLVPKPTMKDGPLCFSRDRATQFYSSGGRAQAPTHPPFGFGGPQPRKGGWVGAWVELLANLSPMIAEAVAKSPVNKFNTGSTSLEWFSRRTKQRIANRTVYLSSGLSDFYY
jgi:hypothetical protein